MAIKTVTLDDLDGSEGAQTIRFSLGDKTWEVDLGESNASRLSRALQPFIEKGREVVGRQRPDVDAAAVRTWAATNGVELAPKGRIPGEIIARYKEAQAA